MKLKFLLRTDISNLHTDITAACHCIMLYCMIKFCGVLNIMVIIIGNEISGKEFKS